MTRASCVCTGRNSRMQCLMCWEANISAYMLWELFSEKRLLCCNHCLLLSCTVCRTCLFPSELCKATKDNGNTKLLPKVGGNDEMQVLCLPAAAAVKQETEPCRMLWKHKLDFFYALVFIISEWSSLENSAKNASQKIWAIMITMIACSLCKSKVADSNKKLFLKLYLEFLHFPLPFEFCGFGPKWVSHLYTLKARESKTAVISFWQIPSLCFLDVYLVARSVFSLTLSGNVIIEKAHLWLQLQNNLPLYGL